MEQEQVELRILGRARREMNINPKCQVKLLPLKKSGSFPNNRRLPLLLYEKVLDLAEGESADALEQHFQRNGWTGAWRNGVYPFHHFHSNTHEVLGCYRGSATLQFGGPGGPTVTLAAGDVAVLPVGTAHKAVETSHDFAVVGAYPAEIQIDYDLCHGDPEEIVRVEGNIEATPRPETDPLFGKKQGLTRLWQPARQSPGTSGGPDEPLQATLVAAREQASTEQSTPGGPSGLSALPSA